MASGTLPGFRDFYPDDFALRAHIFAAWRAVARRYAFVEYDGPPLEPLDLYTQKSGDEIVGQLYNFQDKGGRDVALRPEMTPTFARMVGARANALRKPVRWFSIPQLFRYERAQRGRLREHFQLNVDIVGEPTELADAELLCVAIDIMRELGLGADDVRARVSDRRLLNSVLDAIGVTEIQRGDVYGVLDKIARQPLGVSREKLAAAALAPAAIDAVLALPGVESLGALRALYGASAEVTADLDRLERYVAYVTALGGGDWLQLDLSIVRGLAYYTGIVFELFDAKGELRAICGGGRYDHLLAALGGTNLPALGFGMGDVVLGELLKVRGLVPAPGGSRADVYLVGGDGALDHPIGDALRLASLLRGRGLSVDHALNAEKYAAQATRSQVDTAKKSGARAAVAFEPGSLLSVQGLQGKLMEAPRAQFPAAPLLAGDPAALDEFLTWFNATIPQRSTD